VSRNRLVDNFPQLTEFKLVLPSSRLTVLKTGTYTELMSIGSRLAAALLVAAAISARPARLVAQSAQRSLYVSVLDQSGAPVAALGPTDFIVREDRVTREVLRVDRADEPMQVALLVDNSQAAEPYIQNYREALPALIAALTDADGPKNQITLITLAERPTIITAYTSDPVLLQKGLQRIFSLSGSGTYLLDAIIEVSQEIIKRHSPRPVIIAITTEGPELSDRPFGAVLDRLHDSGAAFHVVIVGLPHNLSHDRAVVLDEGARESGGRYDTLLAGSAMTGTLKQIARDLTSQYRVTYARPQTLIPPERVSVAVTRPGLTARGTLAPEDRERGRQ
jgi:VWFA-related protein